MPIGFKRKGRYVFAGLSFSGKASLAKLLLQEGIIDCLPYPKGYERADEDDYDELKDESKYVVNVY